MIDIIDTVDRWTVERLAMKTCQFAQHNPVLLWKFTGY